MKRFIIPLLTLSLAIVPITATAQSQISGLIQTPLYEGAQQNIPIPKIHVFGCLDGPLAQPASFWSWEMNPAGWYLLDGGAGRQTIVYSAPVRPMRPIVLTNIYTSPGDELVYSVSPKFDFACFDETASDPRAAKAYYQPFVARGSSITSVGFKLVDDGVDGIGGGSQPVLVSVHRKGKGTPDTWKQVGPAMLAPAVDCGGPKNYSFSVGWNSGEVPTAAGETYAVCIRSQKPELRVRSYWRPLENKQGGCYRVGDEGSGYTGADLWLCVGSDSDGLVIPYNKRVHRDCVGETRFARKWSQTYVAQGRSLASVILYAAASGVQPGLMRQRLTVRVREGGPSGALVGVEKIAVGSGNYTGDASWGTFGAVFAPGEVSLVPGKTYAIEFESLENIETLHGFVNCKGMPSDDKPGFHPYPKAAPDDYKQGRAYYMGTEPTDWDLDMQVIEYQSNPANWDMAVDAQNLVKNGDMSIGELATDSDSGRPAYWRTFAIDPGTAHRYVTDLNDTENRVLRVLGGSATQKSADGGFVQQVGGLKRVDTYRLSGKVRCSWPVDARHACYIGFDPTGQVEDPKASSIVWATLPNAIGLWTPYHSDPVRPKGDAISVWLRGKTTLTSDFPFRADFDDVELYRVRTEIP